MQLYSLKNVSEQVLFTCIYSAGQLFFSWPNNYLRCDEWVAADIQNLQILAEFDVFWYFTDI